MSLQAAASVGACRTVDPAAGIALAKLLVPGTAWAWGPPERDGTRRAVMRAPEGTTAPKGTEWPRAVAGEGTGTVDPIGLAMAAGATGLAVVGSPSGAAVCSFETPRSGRVTVPAAGAGGEMLRHLAWTAALENGAATPFEASGAKGRAWATIEGGQLTALHIRIDGRSA
jgi:hypothetical protein